LEPLCAAFESVDPRLSDELTVELDAERGQQVVSEAISEENGRIVFREFGHERRLSELEKKRLHALLNRKTQCTRDISGRLRPRLRQSVSADQRRITASLYKHETPHSAFLI